MTRHVAAWKRKQLDELKKLADSYPVVAVASLRNFPAALFQQLRKKLVGKAVVKVSKTRVIRKALEQSSLDSEKLNSYINESVAVIFTSMNPFELFAFLKRNKGNVAAKAGMLAPADILVPAGDTGLPPGPALSDLKGAGLQVRVQGPTIHIAEDRVVTRKGEAVSAAVAATLAKLDIKPIKVGLNIVACYENKEIFEAGVLDIDAEQVRANFMRAYTNAFNLAFNAGYFTRETVPLLLGRAFREAKALALEAKIVSPETAGQLISVAARQASSLKASMQAQPAEKGGAEEGKEKKEVKAKKQEVEEEKEKKEEKEMMEGVKGEKEEGGKKKEPEQAKGKKGEKPVKKEEPEVVKEKEEPKSGKGKEGKQAKGAKAKKPKK